RRIEQTLLPGLAEAQREAGRAPLSASAWRELTTRLPLHDCLPYAEDRRLRELLDAPPQAVGPERLAAFAAALPEEARRLRAAAEDARARFGTSLGIFPQGPRTLVVELEA